MKEEKRFSAFDVLLAHQSKAVKPRSKRPEKHRKKYPQLEPPPQMVASVAAGKRALRLPLKTNQSRKECRKRKSAKRSCGPVTASASKEPPLPQPSLAASARLRRFDSSAPLVMGKGKTLLHKEETPATRSKDVRWIRKCRAARIRNSSSAVRPNGVIRWWAARPYSIWKSGLNGRRKRCVPWKRRRQRVRRILGKLSTRFPFAGGSNIKHTLHSLNLSFWQCVKSVLIAERKVSLLRFVGTVIPSLALARSFPLYGSLCELVYFKRCRSRDPPLWTLTVSAVMDVVPLEEYASLARVVAVGPSPVPDFLRDSYEGRNAGIALVAPAVYPVRLWFPGSSGTLTDLVQRISKSVPDPFSNNVVALRYKGEWFESGALSLLENRYL